MVLKSLEIQGFKSFPDKTKLTFNKGLTAVVGPNGSGKSNIGDAVKWVLGEQSSKTLRGEKMEDVIFGGTQFRKAVGFAQVSLTIDNSTKILQVDSDEVTITRKYYRSGDSEYMINSANVRLKDINEILMDTGLGKDGYSIIGQGKIADIVSAKSNERREIFEEASGISKFRYKKYESEKKLKLTEENLIRLRDILSELEDRVEPLRKQSEKAKQFLEYSEQKKVLEISLWNKTLENFMKDIKKYQDNIYINEAQHQEITEKIQNVENEVNNIYSEMQKSLIDIENLRQKKQDLEKNISENKSNIAVYNNDIIHNNDNIKRILNEIENLEKLENDNKDFIENKTKEKQNQNDLLTENKVKLENLEKQLLETSQNNNKVTEKVNELNELINKLTLEKGQLEINIFNSQNLILELENRLKQDNEKLDEKLNQHEISQNELKENLKAIENINQKINELENSKKGYNLKVDLTKQKVEKLQNELTNMDLSVKEKKQKVKLLEDLEHNMDGFAYSVKTVMKCVDNGRLSGVFGTVAQLINLDKKYTTAIEIALGGSLQNIVVEDEYIAKKAINILKEQKSGRATFLPLTAIKPNSLNVSGVEKFDGFVSIAKNLVSCDKKYENVISNLLGRIVITEDIDSGIEMAKHFGYKFKIVTLDGQVINAGGSLSGGSANKSSGVLSRKNDIEKLNVEIKELSKVYNNELEQFNLIKSEFLKLDSIIKGIDSEQTVLNQDKIRFESEIKHFEHIILECENYKNQINNNISNLKNQIDELKNKQLGFDNELKNNLKQVDLNKIKLEKIVGNQDETNQKREFLSNEISNLKIDLIQINNYISSINNIIYEYQNRLNSSSESMKNLDIQVKQYEQKNADINKQIEDLKKLSETQLKQIDELQLKVEQTIEKRKDFEAKTTQTRNLEKELSNEKEIVSRELARLEERKISIQKEYDNIIHKMWEEYQLTRTDCQEFAKPVENVLNTQRDLNEIKSKIKNLGSVNVSAIEEYKEVSQRYEFLSVQVKDIEKSKVELINLINELTSNMQQIFSINFEKINQNFKNIFVELFGGGKAELKLTDLNNVLDCGIEIFVQPPGKIIKNLSSLSGGEQAFIAIAIYFAILKVRPAPFCILDEIEAALDDVNVLKYAKYLRLMSDKTQFILITHRRGSMEQSDVLYGVTMEQQGISKLLQLELSEVSQRLGMKEVD